MDAAEGVAGDNPVSVLRDGAALDCRVGVESRAAGLHRRREPTIKRVKAALRPSVGRSRLSVGEGRSPGEKWLLMYYLFPVEIADPPSRPYAAI